MKVLAAIDLSRASSYVVEAVHRVATATDAEVHLLHVVTPLPSIAGPEFQPVMEPMVLADSYLDEQDQLNGLMSQLTDVGVNAKALIATGNPVSAVLREAKRLDAELIVVGSHGHGLLYDALLGSVSTGILRKSPIPVLVVPTRES
jgi:nucleotide-binding universal stress UspA family protein